MQFDFTDMRVLITGGTRGIGNAVAKAYLDAGASVAINGRSEQSVNATIKVMGEHRRLFPAPADVGTVAGCETAVDLAMESLGGLDILINAAGIAEDQPVEASDEKLWDHTLNVNLKGTFFCCRSALGALRASKGNIVNVASDTGMMGVPDSTVYCASKAGVVNLTRAMAIELAPDVRVNCVCPTYLDTDMIHQNWRDQLDYPATSEQRLKNYAPLKRIATREEIAHSILYLSSPSAIFTTGKALQIDGNPTADH